jgi:hypothetical protein
MIFPSRTVVAAALVALVGGLVTSPVMHVEAPRVTAAAVCDFTETPDQTIPSPLPYSRRIAGHDRYQTSACASIDTWLSPGDGPASEVASAVVLARGDTFPDALAGAPFAAQVHGPLLLTTPNALRPEIRTEIQRVLAHGGPVYLLGGTGSLSQSVAGAVSAMGYVPHRIAGADRYETAVKIAQAMPATSQFYFTTGANFPDALVAGEAAAYRTRDARGLPDVPPAAVLFTADATMPAVTANFASARRTQLGYALFRTAGGAADTATTGTFGADDIVDHYVGADRFQTATMIAEDTYASGGDLFTNNLGLVDGTHFPDALSGSVHLSQRGAIMLLTQPTALNARTRAFLNSHANEGLPQPNIHVIGGQASVSNATAAAAVKAITPR